jgi:hypothetical protein
VRSVSQAFIDALLKDTPDIKREVSYKRRYWDAATKTYKWETSWTVLAESEVAGVSPMTEQLDSQNLNEFKASNISITVKNNDNRWRPDNRAGKFAPDSASPLYFYSDYWTKFRIRLGIKLYPWLPTDTTYEYTTRFVGLAVEYTYSSQDDAQITVQGLESLLMNTNAEDVSTLVTGESLGTGNGVTTQFTTAHPGVGIIVEVSVAGITSVPPAYTVSQLNDTTLGAKITFAAAPASGTIRATYKYWTQSANVETLVASLLTQAGISGGSQVINPVIFPKGVSHTFSQDTQVDWLAGSLTSLEATSSPGDLKIDFGATGNRTLLDDFSDGNFTSNPVWTKETGTFSASIVAGKMKIPASAYSTPSTAVIGRWDFDYTYGNTASTAYRWMFMGEITAATYGVNPANGYSIDITDQGVSGTKVRIRKWGATANSTDLAVATLGAVATSHTFTVTRDANGLIKLYVDSVLTASATDTTYFTSSKMCFFNNASSGNTQEYSVDNIYVPATTQGGTYISQSLDAGSAPTAWGQMSVSQDFIGTGAATISTRSSTDGISWDSWVDISENGQINSALKRYLQVRWVPTAANTARNDATLHSFTFRYATLVTTIALANFTGKTVYDAIQSLGSFANYEWGFTPDETFFFRPKTVQKDSVLNISETNFILDNGITGMVSGQDRVYGEVHVAYGAFTTIVKGAVDSEGQALAKFGTRVLEISDGDILISSDADVASGIAQSFISEVGRAKRRFRATCKLMPHIDLSDVLLVSFNQNRPATGWSHGDTTVRLGDQTLQHYGPGMQVVSEMYAKVIGARHDPDNSKTELEFQEVL